MTSKRVYVAGPWAQRDEVAIIAKGIEEAGHEITRKWWLYEAGNEEYDKLREQAQADFDAVLSADVMFLCNWQKRGEETSGKAVEQGIALMNCIPIIGIGHSFTNIFHVMDDYTWFNSVGDAIDAIGRS